MKKKRNIRNLTFQSQYVLLQVVHFSREGSSATGGAPVWLSAFWSQQGMYGLLNFTHFPCFHSSPPSSQFLAVHGYWCVQILSLFGGGGCNSVCSCEQLPPQHFDLTFLPSAESFTILSNIDYPHAL